MKIREDLARDDYRDPGPYKHPAGTVAYEIDAPAVDPPRQQPPATNDKKAAKPINMKGTKMKM